MKTSVESGKVQAEGTGPGGGGAPPMPQLHVAGLPPGVAPQIDLDAAGRSAEAETFLAPTPRPNGTFLGYGRARVGRMPPYGGSPSIGPLEGIELRWHRPPPVPPSYRKQALEPGHQEPDPLLRIPAIETNPRTPGEAMADGLDRLERSVAVMRALPAPRTGGAGRHAPVTAAVGPAGAGGARVAASLGVPVADTILGSGRGTYVAGRASGARWDANASVAPRGAGLADPCAGPVAGRKGRALGPLQSMKRYVQQQAALTVEAGADPGASRPPEVQPVSVSGSGTKGMSTGMKAFSALSKGGAAPPSRAFAAMEGRQGEDAGTKPDPDAERRLLALRAEIGGLAGRFGARSRRCRMDTIEALRPARGLAEWRQASATRKGGQQAQGSSPPTREKLPDAPSRKGGNAAAPGAVGGCAVPQKYPARAGVAMRDSPDATEAAPPGGAGAAHADDGIATGPQGPVGQTASPRQEGTDTQARGEAAPGAAGGGSPAERPVVVAQGMGGPGGPSLLNVERMLRDEAQARLFAQASAESLREVMGSYGEEVKADLEDGRILEANGKLLGKLGRAETELAGLDGTKHTATLAEAIRDAKRVEAEIRAQKDAADGSSFFGTAQLSLLDEASKRAAADLERLEKAQQRLRMFGSMDRASLRELALAATHRAELESHRAARRALRRERGGVSKARQYAKVIAASERAFDMEKRARRHESRAVRMKDGSSAQARAFATANYYGSLAEHERHRASIARSHVMGQELARTRGFRGFLKEKRRRDEEGLRNDRKRIGLERFRNTYAPRYDAADAQLRGLALTDEHGNFVDRDGNKVEKYVAKDPKDQAKVRRLQGERERLGRKLRSRLGHVTHGPHGPAWSNITALHLANKNPAAGGQPALPNPLAGTAAGHLIDYGRALDALRSSIDTSKMSHAQLRKLGSLIGHVRAQINSLMTEKIADAASKAKAAVKAGLDAGIRVHDPALSDEERAQAAEQYADAKATADGAVQEIRDEMEIKRQNGAYEGEGGKEEKKEDEKKLREAQEAAEELVDVCNHPSCDKGGCERKAKAGEVCKLRVEGGSGGGSVAGGTGTSISSQDPSAPGGGGAVSPDGGTEADGKDEPEGDAEAEAGRRRRHPGETYTSAEPPKPEEEEKEKPQLKQPDVGGVFRHVTAGVVRFAATVQARIRAVPVNPLLPPAPPADEEEKVEKARKAQEERGRINRKHIERELARLKVLRAMALRQLAQVAAVAATREQAIEMAGEAIARLREAEAAVSALIEKQFGERFRAEFDRLGIRFTLFDDVYAKRPKLAVESDPEFRRLESLLDNVRFERQLLEANVRTLRRDTSHEEEEARRAIGESLRAEQQALLDLDFDRIQGKLEGLRPGWDPGDLDDELRRLDQRMQWAALAARHAAQSVVAVQQEEMDRNGLGGEWRNKFAKWKAGEGYANWADAAARHFTGQPRPDFDGAPTDGIQEMLDTYKTSIERFREDVRAVGGEIEAIQTRAVVGKIALGIAVVASWAASIASLGLTGTLAVAGTGFLLGNAYSAATQGAMLLQHGGEFSVGEMLETGVGFAAAGPAARVVPGAGHVLRWIGVAHGVSRLADGEWDGVVDLLAVGFPSAIKAVRGPRSGSPQGAGQLLLAPEGGQPTGLVGGRAGVSGRAGIGGGAAPGEPPHAVKPGDTVNVGRRGPAINLGGEAERPGVINQNTKWILDPNFESSRLSPTTGKTETLAQLRARPDRPQFVVSTNDRLPFRSDYFETVYTTSVPLHPTAVQPGPGIVRSEVIRILRPGGRWIHSGTDPEAGAVRYVKPEGSR